MKNYLGKEVGLFVLLCFFNCGLIFVLLFWRLIILSWSCKQKFVSHLSDSEMPDYNPKWVKQVSPPPPGTTLTRANSKQILQALDPGFIRLQELRQAHQPKQGTQEMAVPGRSKIQGLNSYKDSTIAQKITTKGIRKYPDTFCRDVFKFSCGKWKINDYKYLKIFMWKNEMKRLYPYIFNFKKIVISYFFSFSCMKFFWLCTWVQETQSLKKRQHSDDTWAVSAWSWVVCLWLFFIHFIYLFFTICTGRKWKKGTP